jgi:predicted O-methyltransferase YrrM
MVDIINHVGVLMEALSDITMKSSLNDPKVTELLDVLYAEAAKSDALNRTTEFEANKAGQAKRNLAAAGLEQWVESRVGDALETLSDPPREIDMIFLDGAKSLYLGVFKLLEPQLRSGGIVASDNTGHGGMAAFLDYIRDCRNGYTSAAILTSGERGKVHEITVRH